MANNYIQYKVGTILVCIKPESVAYKRDKEYTIVEKDKVKGLVGDDGYFDPLSKLVSFFKPLDASQQAVRNLKIVK